MKAQQNRNDSRNSYNDIRFSMWERAILSVKKLINKQGLGFLKYYLHLSTIFIIYAYDLGSEYLDYVKQ